MNMMIDAATFQLTLTRTEVAGMVALAARSVSPLWPLESAIAVNPLSGFEDLAFEEAVKLGATQFGANATLPITVWRNLVKAGRIDEQVLRRVAVLKLGGFEAAFELLGPDISRYDLLMARLLHTDLPKTKAALPLSPDRAFVAKWCSAFFDQGQAACPMPHRELGLYRAVVALAAHDPDFAFLVGKAAKILLLTVPRDPLEAIAEALALMNVPAGEEVDRISALVMRLPGWAGHIRWRSDHADADVSEGAPAAMADLVALWLLLERAGALSSAPSWSSPVSHAEQLAAHFGLSSEALDALGPTARQWFDEIALLDDAALGALFMAAAETAYRDDLVAKLEPKVGQSRPDRNIDAQLVFCIDVRSEPFRRAVEAEGLYDTYGYAGFFGLPIALHKAGAERRKRFLPVLLSPQHDVAEAPVQGMEDLAENLARKAALTRRTTGLFDMAKRGTTTAFATAEATGPVAGALMAARTLFPAALDRFVGKLAPQRHRVLAPSLHAGPEDAEAPFTLEEKVGYAAALFKLTGLPAETARLVVLTGHSGQAVNNPYAAALDCGACGGHAGGSNARILAAMLNSKKVRLGLAKQGIVIPETTVFLAAEHNTTTDEVIIFDRCQVPASHQDDLKALTAALERAGSVNRLRRAAALGRSPEDLLKGAVHWGEVRPEWGLAGNAGFIVAPRSLTADVDLDGRAFLHSYDWEKDADGSALTTILTAPMVVAQWINCQYLFSTIDNERYGSGDKVTQNVLGGIGVVQGNGGDLRIGLPLQSLFADDGTPQHLPQRLLTIVHAPLARVDEIVTSNDILARLFGGGWVNLVVIDPVTKAVARWKPDSEIGSASLSTEQE